METVVDTIDYKLAEMPPQKNYCALKLDRSKLFAGYIIRNLYDEQRFEIDRKYKPHRFSFLTSAGDYKLYGITRDSQDFFVKKLELKKFDNLVEYNSFLSFEGLSCLTCFLHFAPGMYPVDSSYLTRYFSDIDFCDFNKKKNISPFQKFAHIYFFALIDCKK